MACRRLPAIKGVGGLTSYDAGGSEKGSATPFEIERRLNRQEAINDLENVNDGWIAG
jgi:hypothetical protein